MAKKNKILTFPGRNSRQSEAVTAKNRKVVIVGANGAGKSRLAVWLAKENNVEVDKESLSGICHLITAKRQLTVPEASILTSTDIATKKWLYGNEHGHFITKRSAAWIEGQTGNALLTDFDAVLSVLFSQSARFYEEHYKGGQVGVRGMPDAQKLTQIWQKIFPHRDIDFSDAKVKLIFQNKQVRLAAAAGGGIMAVPYPGKEMSDGERSALYLIAQCICLPSNSTVIIDEPEIHLHRSVRDQLWDEIEKAREDCCFVYVTHDLDFAAARGDCTYVWVESYDGNSWDWKELALRSFAEEVPDSLKLQIYGSRRNVLFVEGTDGSFDASIYRLLFPKLAVIPRDSCTTIKSQVSSLSKAKDFTAHVSITGLIDRDRMQDEEVAALAQSGVHVLEVAEVESIFCLEEVIRDTAAHLLRDENKAVEDCYKRVLNRFKLERDQQIAERAMAELKYRINGRNVGVKDQGDLEKFVEELSKFDATIFFKSAEKEFNDALATGKLNPLLKLYNRKSLAAEVAGVLGLKNSGEYQELVVRRLQHGNQALANAMFVAVPPALRP